MQSPLPHPDPTAPVLIFECDGYWHRSHEMSETELRLLGFECAYVEPGQIAEYQRRAARVMRLKEAI